jgi:hypothetical protein
MTDPLAVRIVGTTIATDSAGRATESLPIRYQSGPDTNEVGKPVTPQPIVETITGRPARIVTDKVVLNSAGKPVASTLILGLGFEAETIALLARASVQPNSARATLINNLYAGMKSAGLFAKHDRFWINAAHDRQAARLNWVANNNDLTEVDAANLSWTVDRGYQGNGTSSHVTGGTYGSLVKFTRDDCCFWGWMWDSAQVNTTPFGADGNFNILLAPRTTSNKLFTRVNDATATASLDVTDAKGLCGFSRAVSTEYHAFKGDTRALVSVASANNPSGSVSAGKTGSQFSLGKFSAFGLCSNLNQTDITNLKNLLTAYMTGVGAV